MEKLKQTDTQNEGPKNLDELFMELFTREFLESLPPGHIETVINNLRLVASSFETIPPEWVALRSVLQERGFLKKIIVLEKS